MQWTLLFTALFNEEFVFADMSTPWLDSSQCTLFTGLGNIQSSLSLIEDRFANFAALYYALLDRHFQVENTLAAKWWRPLTGEVAGIRQELSAQLGVNGAQLVVGSICILVLIISSLFSMGRQRRTDNIIWSGGVIDMITLLYDSAIPSVIMEAKEDDDSELEHLKKAEQIEIRYEEVTIWI